MNATDFNGVAVVQNYLNRTGREEWARQVWAYSIFYILFIYDGILINYLYIYIYIVCIRYAKLEGIQSRHENYFHYHEINIRLSGFVP